ncbi:NADPH:quinone oxidoreductase family protein [Streptosporangium sp. NPDC087985]|uniref:NADPH:quinone oxidoreductase family protein n=1 Tax=Streptosporangium sp. NPDC087985 TaxID=3366196 RepID=UPI0037F59DA8
MKALQVSELGEPRDVLRIADVDQPEPEPGQVVIRVRAAAANFPDVLMCQGGYQVKPELPFTPGIEACGDVVSVGKDVGHLAVGDRVIGLTVLPSGSFAEYSVLDASVTFPAPSGLDDAQAAAMFVAYQTGWFGLHRRGRLQAGETLLVHAAAGGVGSAAVELGKAAGARVIAVVGGADKVDVARRLGADIVVDRKSEDFVKVVKEATGGRGADVVYDPVGGDAYHGSTKCIAFEGRIVLVGFAGGQIQTAKLNHPLIKNYSIEGYVWGAYRRNDLPAVHRCHQELTALAQEGRIHPLVGETVDLAGLPDAIEKLAQGLTVGRVAMVA